MLVSNIATLTENDSENEQTAALVCFVIKVTGRILKYFVLIIMEFHKFK
jgi:hypothetical protein